jgi:hypothetical protein
MRRIETLSLAALRMAASSLLDDPAVIAQWLYRFGTVPRGPAIDRDFGPDDDPMAVLGMTIGGIARRQLEASYEASSFPGWYSFARTSSPALVAPACKLYISPRPEALAQAFPRIADELVRVEVRSFKVGRGIEGLLRPDKIVAYFDDRAHMAAAAAALERSLLECPAQGVPFTTEVGGNGLLSSGVDPPPGSVAVSWRSWVTKRLAASLAAPLAGSPEVRVAGALADICLAGIDPETWQPNADAFRDEGAS